MHPLTKRLRIGGTTAYMGAEDASSYDFNECTSRNKRLTNDSHVRFGLAAATLQVI